LQAEEVLAKFEDSAVARAPGVAAPLFAFFLLLAFVFGIYGARGAGLALHACCVLRVDLFEFCLILMMF
jgi:hypothetical protein